jgi:hypothetical protein
MILPNAAILKKIIASPGSPKMLNEDGTLFSIAAPRIMAAIISPTVILLPLFKIQW